MCRYCNLVLSKTSRPELGQPRMLSEVAWLSYHLSRYHDYEKRGSRREKVHLS